MPTKPTIFLAILLLLLAACTTNQPNSTAADKPIPKETPTRQLAITIDDLPGISLNDYQAVTDNLLTTLKAFQAPAIGFVNEGKLYQKNKLNKKRFAVLEDWLKAGMELGNHTYSHPDYNKLTFAEYTADLTKGERHTKALQAKHQQQMRYFRHPFLHMGDTAEKEAELANFLTEHGYTVAPVTIDNSEWLIARAYYLAQRANNKAQMDSIGNAYVEYMEDMTAYYEQQSEQLFGRPIMHTLLLHANALNGDYLDELLAMYRKRGYEFISLTEALTDSVYQSDNTYVTRGGISWIHRWAKTQGVDRSFFAGEPTCPEFIQTIAGIKE
ncbi:MAG: polysaccharide deacetylase family protein [Saprospiraceae bacterium]